jgi:hypothetical protein
MATKPSTRGTPLANIALLLGSTLATLLTVEIAFRAYARVQDYRTARALERVSRAVVAQHSTTERKFERLIRLSPNDRIIYEFIPDISATFKGQRIHINAEGFRGVSRAFAKPCRTLRVLGIGDSVMFGWGIAEARRGNAARIPRSARIAQQIVAERARDSGCPRALDEVSITSTSARTLRDETITWGRRNAITVGEESTRQGCPVAHGARLADSDCSR